MKNRLQLLQVGVGYLTLLLGVIYSSTACAAAAASPAVGDIGDVLNNIANNSIPGLTVLMTAFSYLIGFWFVYRSLYELRKYGELRTMMRVETNLMKPMSLFFIGVMLVYWPTALAVFMQTVFTTDSPLSYQDTSLNSSYQYLIDPIVRILQFIGFVSFVRGMVLLTGAAEQGAGSQGILGKAMAHIIGGILLVNIYATWQVLYNTMFSSAV